jgi:hypothetical protein
MRIMTAALAIVMAPFVVAPPGRAAPVPRAPEVIAPGALPMLHALLPEHGTVLASSASRPAPMPDDQDAPLPPSADGAQLMPTLYPQRDHFEGDGYAHGSTDHARPMQPAAGAVLDLPLN